MSDDHSKPVKKYKKMKDRGKVHPDAYQNGAYEMDSVEEEKAMNKKGGLNKFQSVASKGMSARNALNVITTMKTNASRWRKYATTRRKPRATDGQSPGSASVDRKRTGGLGLEYEVGDNDFTDGPSLTNTQREMVVAHNRNLIEYFARLAQSDNEDECVNLEYVDSLLKSGAKIDCTDKYGQSIFHEVARAWHIDIAKFLLEHKANINQADVSGRTPLHVAAAVDYPEMANFLIENGADKEAKTKAENQTPLHFAARNDACQSLKALVKAGCLYKEERDYKGRTPLHVAAELDRSETARMLLQLDDPAPAGVTDDAGQAAIVWMIAKMPPVAKIALDQFHTTDRANRRQYYHLHELEPRKHQKLEKDAENVHPKKAMQVLVNHNQHELITHAAVMRLIHQKWKKFGLKGAIISTLINLTFIVLWSINAVAIEYDKRHLYVLPEQWWRILLFILALGMTIYQLEEELSEYIHSKKAHQNWKDWREQEIQRDLELCHPRWPEEKAYLVQQLDELDKKRPQYFNDFWNIYDWICYAFLLISIVTHLVDVFTHTHFVARLHIRIMCVTVILLWLRLMKNARAFSLLGPFIVMLGHMLGDVAKFGFLYLEFYIPYAFAFWMLFGENKVPEEYQGLPDADNYTVSVNGFGTANAMMFSLFRITLVDDYDYDGMKKVDSIMADILVGTWLAISAILMLNLFIALLSDTFQRVYDNAKANAIMQKAIFILNIEEGMSKKRKEKFRKFIEEECAPEVEDYDDDATGEGGDDLKKVAFQIKDQIDELMHHLSEGDEHRNILDSDDDYTDGGTSNRRRQLGGGGVATRDQVKKLVTVRKLEKEMDTIRDDIQSVVDRQESFMSRLKTEIETIKDFMQQMASHQGIVSPGLVEPTLVRQPGVSLSRHLSSLSAGQAPLDYNQLSRMTPPSLSQSVDPRLMSRAPLSTITDQGEWEQLEQERQQELEELRQRLADRARVSGSTAADSRPSITPNSTTDANDA